MRSGLMVGRLKIYLRGERLKGSWALVRMQRSQKNWLLIKHDDEFARTNDDVLEENTSVSSGRSIEDLKKAAKTA